MAARIMARYGRGRHADQVTFEYRTPQGEVSELRVVPLDPDEIPSDWLI
jgi:hypothetical protein